MKKLKKEEIGEDYCFVCKDGGNLRICDYGDCLKSYHAQCEEKEESFLDSKEHWSCRWHQCFMCPRPSKFECFTCPMAVCGLDFNLSDFTQVRGRKAFCWNCLRLAALVEKNIDVVTDDEGAKVDFNEEATYERYFREYYNIIKETEGLTAQMTLSAVERYKSGNRSEADNEDDCRSEDDGLVSDYENIGDKPPQRVNKKRKRPSGRKRKSQKSKTSHEDDKSPLVPCQNEKRIISNRKSSELEVPSNKKSCDASIVVENINLIYLRKTLVDNLLKEDREIFKEKAVGCFVRIKSDPHGCLQKSSHQLVKITGVNEASTSGETRFLLQDNGIPISDISDEDFSPEELDDLRQRVDAGLVDKITVVDLEQKATMLHKEVTKHVESPTEPLLFSLANVQVVSNSNDMSGYLEQPIDCDLASSTNSPSTHPRIAVEEASTASSRACQMKKIFSECLKLDIPTLFTLNNQSCLLESMAALSQIADFSPNQIAAMENLIYEFPRLSSNYQFAEDSASVSQRFMQSHASLVEAAKQYTAERERIEVQEKSVHENSMKIEAEITELQLKLKAINSERGILTSKKLELDSKIEDKNAELAKSSAELDTWKIRQRKAVEERETVLATWESFKKLFRGTAQSGVPSEARADGRSGQVNPH